MMARRPTDTVQLKLRFSEKLRRQLERAATKSDQSLNAEIVSRLEQSFESVARLEDVFGGARNVALFRSIAGAIQRIEGESGKNWREDVETRTRVQAAMWAEMQTAAHPKDWYRAIALALLADPNATDAPQGGLFELGAAELSKKDKS